MNDKTIKEILTRMFLIDFDIEKHVDYNITDSQSFEHTVSMEFKDSKGNWHEAYLHTCGTIYINKGESYYHNPLNDGRLGEQQGDPNTIDYFEINEAESYFDGDQARFTISSHELHAGLFANNLI